MCIKRKLAVFATALTLLPALSQAQVEKMSSQERGQHLAQIPELTKTLKSEDLKQHLLRAQKGGEKKLINAIRTISDVPSDFRGDLLHYNVDPTSGTQYLPDAYPFDGSASAPVRIIAARGEYEPGSFVVYPLKNLGKVKLELGEFKSAEGKILPPKDLDLKVVKVWYQNKNAWYSYFGDTGLKLVPELLVNDEDLIQVDTKKGTNYARVTKPDGKFEYHWLTAPPEIDSRYEKHFRKECVFLSMAPGFDDAEKLLPVTLNEGEFKQFFLTVHAPENAIPGTYQGNVSLNTADGKNVAQIPVSIRILPFKLPRPKTYANPEKDFLVYSYSYTSFEWFRVFNGGDQELAEKQFLSYMKNKVRHNENLFHLHGSPGSYEFKRGAELQKEAGAQQDYVLGYQAGIPWDHNAESLKKSAKKLRAIYDQTFPEKPVVFIGYGDECGAQWFVENRPLFETYQKEGFKFWIAGNNQTFFKAGYFWDFFNISRPPEESEATRQWNEVGRAWTAWYAQHHVGPENPAFTRRQYGMAPYLANYSALSNYAHHLGPMNDLNKDAYKPMVFSYGVHNGELDTLAWEAFREGIDDIRYATLLKTLALKAQKSPELSISHAGGRALQFLAEFNKENTDLAEARLEMIRLILELRTLLKIND